jgi:transcriptional regulator with XRE-family HTH domain
MPLNVPLLIEIREKCKMSRVEFAKHLNISRNYLLRIETKQKNASLKVIEKIAVKTGLSLDRLILLEDGEEGPNAIKGFIPEPDIKTELNNERSLRMEQNLRTIELEQDMIEAKMREERYWAVICLYKKYVGIIRREDISQREKNQKIRELAKKTALDGELQFNEILETLGFTRSELKEIIGKREYKCKLDEDFSVEAPTPGAAALMLRCSVCEHRQNRECAGYSVEKAPIHVGELVKMLEENGCLTREEHAKIIMDFYYHLPVSAHDVSEALHRLKNGKPAQRGLMYLEPTQKDEK